MKKLNTPLILGTLLIALILAVILFPRVFTSKSPYNMQHLIYSHVNGSLEVKSAPFPPSPDFILGSDDMGRDIYSLIIYGTRLTILLGVLTALSRFLFAIPMALSAGFGNKTSRSAIRQFNILFSAIPALLISVLILKLDFVSSLSKGASIVAFVIVMSVVGWPKLGSLLMERIDSINQQPFIRSEVAIGKSRLKIAIENVFPHLAPEMVVLFFMEIARALSMIMQLGIFSVFVGLLGIVMDTEGGVTLYDISFEPEWAGMLSTSKNFISVAPWAVMFPALAFFISVLGFNLFGEGLRNMLQQSDSLFIPRIRKLLSFDIKYIWGSFSRKGRVISIASASFVVISLIVSVFAFRTKPLDISVSDLPDFDVSVIGTEEAYQTAEIIKGKMEALGLQPLEDAGFIVNYKIPSVSLIIEQSLKLNGSEEYTPGVDFNILDCADGNFSGEIYDATTDDLFTMQDLSGMNGKFVMIDKAYYNAPSIAYLMQKIEDHASVKGILLVAGKDESLFDMYASKSGALPRVLISKETAESIKAASDPKISISFSAKELYGIGFNVMGMLKGTDDLLNEEAIVIALPHNFTGNGEKEVLAMGLQVMEEICGADNNRRSVIFVFMDGTDNEMLSGINAFSEDYPYSPTKTKLFINMLDVNEARFDSLNYSDLQAPFTRQYAWSMGRQLGINLKQAGIDINEARTTFFGDQYYFTEDATYNTMFMKRGLATIIIAADEEGSGSNSLGDLGRILIDTIEDNNY